MIDFGSRFPLGTVRLVTAKRNESAAKREKWGWWAHLSLNSLQLWRDILQQQLRLLNRSDDVGRRVLV